MKKILLPVIESDYRSTEKRLFNIAKGLSEHFVVEFLTISKDTCEDIKNKAADCRNITAEFIEPGLIPLTLDFRSHLVKVFVQYTNDLFIPDTDLKLWKTAAFDDFWGHLSASSLDESSLEDTDLVLLPLMSFDNNPSENDDVFYTSLLFRAKEAGVKVAGYQLYPVFQGHKLMTLMVDALIVKKEYERQFYVNMGVAADDIFLLTDAKDKYSISTITDAYKDNLYNAQIPIRRDELAVVVINHSKFRPCIREIVRAIGDAKVPVVLFLVKRSYGIKDLTEDQIIEDFYYEDIIKAGCRFYKVESESMVPVIMISDVVISPAYVAPVELAARYEKKSIVYNPFYDTVPDVEGTAFIGDRQHLSSALKKAYKEKQMTVGMADAISAILRKAKGSPESRRPFGAQ